MRAAPSPASILLALCLCVGACSEPPAFAPMAPGRIACVGNSITFGAGIDPYPRQLQGLLRDQWQVRNFGVSARTLLRKGNFPYWNEKAFQEAKNFAPNAVILMLGTNDTKPLNWVHKDEFAADYRDLVKAFQDLPGKPRVYVCRPCPVPEPGNFGINETNVQAEIKIIDQLAREMKLPTIDMHAALVSKPELMPDRVHPNTAGAGLMARAAYQALTDKPAPAATPAP